MDSLSNLSYIFFFLSFPVLHFSLSYSICVLVFPMSWNESAGSAVLVPRSH